MSLIDILAEDEHVDLVSNVVKLSNVINLAMQWKYPECSLRASGLFRCVRYNVLHLLGAPCATTMHDSRLRMTFDTGHAIHKMLQGYLANSREYFFSPEVVATKMLFNVAICGTCDGVLIRRKDSYKFGIELKTMRSFLFSKLTGAREDHVLQASTYMWLLDLPEIIIYYWNKDTHSSKEFTVNLTQSFLTTLQDRIYHIKECAKIAVNSENSGGWKSIVPNRLPKKASAECSFCEHAEFCESCHNV